MINNKSFLSLEFGAGSVKIAEFESNDAGSLTLKQYGIKPLGIEGSQDAKREGALQKALTELLAQNQFKSKLANVCAPGFHVFSKFVKLPPVDSSKVTQIIQYEAQQNVPYPLEEAVWDYQIMGATNTGEIEVFLVAMKTEMVEGLFAIPSGLITVIWTDAPCSSTSVLKLQTSSFLRRVKFFAAASISARIRLHRTSLQSPKCRSPKPKKSKFLKVPSA